MIQYLATGAFLGGGGYMLLLGLGKSLWPIKCRGHDGIAILGRVFLFLGMLLVPTCFGFSLSEIGDWLEDIWTTGGGGGTG